MRVEEIAVGFSMRNPHPVFIVLAVALVGCASVSVGTPDSVDPDQPKGMWLFAYLQRGPIPGTPPTFDILDFGQTNNVTLISSLRKEKIDGIFKLNGNDLMLTFQPPKNDQKAELRLKMKWAEQGEGLVLSAQDMEMVFYRADRFLNDDLTGEWVAEVNGETEIMVLGKDGTYSLPRSNVAGYFRLWRSTYGKTITTSFIVPGEGGFTVIQKYDRTHDVLTLTPIALNGLDQSKSLSFHLKKSK